MMRFLTPLLILGLAAVSFFYFTTPVLKEIDGLKIDKAKYTAALDNATKLDARQRQLQEIKINMDPNDLADLDELLPNNIDNVRLIIDINTIAKKNGLTVKNPSIAGEAGAGQPAPVGNPPATNSVKRAGLDKNSVVISFSVSASYEILKRFLDDLSRSLRIVDIESVSFSGNDKNLYDYKISLRTYWLK
ncbi:MAG: hypothetical protein V1704_01080 [Candidatus Vogelbacteria bacterium]